jgi:serine/threonine protein phosphatase PrpC
VSTELSITVGTASNIGDRTANADAAATVITPLGMCAAVVDGVGSSSEVCTAARLAADVAAVVGSHKGAQAGIMAAADTMPDYPDAPNAVAAVVSVIHDQIEIAHVGDAAVFTWDGPGTLRRWTVNQTVGAHIDHMRTNPGLTEQDRRALDEVVLVMDDYILNGLKFATINTIVWTPLRGPLPRVVVLTSDGVHKMLGHLHLNALITQHRDNPQALADAIVANAVRHDDPDEYHKWSQERAYGHDAGPLPPGSRDNATVAVIRIQPVT